MDLITENIYRRKELLDLEGFSRVFSLTLKYSSILLDNNFCAFIILYLCAVIVNSRLHRQKNKIVFRDSTYYITLHSYNAM